ncbi:PAS domain S-box protein [Fictibacillus sp. KIGAM418]|uniref:Oxygen sensor histidine kinase NreB n=1 Tax=Fictibacillus marinisediminis TaxID=2878389 RepID=A0A9X1XFA4_9BACL|nr:PAS domain S-box protein [Fictibacillus marinisediminis]MCK6259066.1 PAS domain S-box protein [Fictibacillus marinisediminis]
MKFMDRIKTGTIVISLSGEIQSVNDRARVMFGDPVAEEAGMGIGELLPGFDIQKMEEENILFQTGSHRDGHVIPLYIKIHSFMLHDELYYMLELWERKGEKNEIEKHLKELADLKFALDESAIVAITDRRGIISYVNDKFCQVSKYSAQELLGSDHRLINSGCHSKEFMRNLWKTILKGNVWRGELKNKAKDGTYYWVDTTIVPFLDENGKPYQFLAIRYEITEHKQVVEELKNSIQELVDLKFALDESSIVAITDARGKITYVNDLFCKISQYSREELIGKNHRIINSNYHSHEFFKQLWQTISSGKVWKGEIRNRAKDGTYYWVDTTIVPFLDENGKPYQYLAIRFEITDKKRVEKELQHMMTRLLDVQEEERKRLSRNLHDGVGQNLYGHLITINRMRSKVEHPLLDQMQEEVSELIEEVRDISWELRPSVLDDLGLVPAIRSFLTRFAENYQIAVSFDCSLSGSRLGFEKETTIYRVIQESLTNVRKYACVDEASVSIRGWEDGLRVVISDEGCGFGADHQKSGVGLFSMEERARSVGGKLKVRSAAGQGTTVVLELPMVPGTPI